MKTINNTVFLSKISQRIKNGDFDEYLDMPFMTKELLYTIFKNRLSKKIDTGGTPILSDKEILESIEDARETSLNMLAIYLKLGFVKKTENSFEFTEKWFKIRKLV